MVQERQGLLQTFIRPSLPITPAPVAIFSNDKKGCINMYRLLIINNKYTIKSISKFEKSEVQFTELEWENIFELRFKVSQKSKLQRLQLWILLRLFPAHVHT